MSVSILVSRTLTLSLLQITFTAHWRLPFFAVLVTKHANKHALDYICAHNNKLIPTLLFKVNNALSIAENFDYSLFTIE